MGKISDIWVRLGLKKNEFDRGMDDATRKTKQTGNSMQKMLSAAKAGWAAVGAAVIAFGREMITATNKVGDAWAHTMAEVKGGWQSILADISNYKPDFSSFKNFFKNEFSWIKNAFGNAKEAGDAAREMSKAFDAEFELTNSLKIQRAKISGELADLQVEMRNMALSPEARMAAVERYRALLEPLYQAEIETRRTMLDAAVKAWMAGSGVTASTADVVDFFTNYGTDAAGAAARNPELARIYETRKADKTNQPIFDAIYNLTQAENGLSVELKMVNRTANSIASAIKDGKIDLAAIDAAILEGVDADIEESLQDIDLSDIEVIPPDFSGLDAILKQTNAEMDAFIAEWQNQLAEIAMLNGMLEQSIVSAMGNGLQALTDMMFGLEGADASQVLAGILSPFADTMTQLGEMLIAEGIAISAFKKALTDLDPAVAIGAGVALLAMGAALKSGIQKLGANAGGGGATSSYTGGGSYGSNPELNYESTLTVEVVGKLNGSDIFLSGQKTLNKWNR